MKKTIRLFAFSLLAGLVVGMLPAVTSVFTSAMKCNAKTQASVNATLALCDMLQADPRYRGEVDFSKAFETEEAQYAEEHPGETLDLSIYSSPFSTVEMSESFEKSLAHYKDKQKN